MQQENQLMRLREVQDLCKVSRAQLYKLIKANTFPRQIRLGAHSRSVAWVRAEVEAWVHACIEHSRIEGTDNV